MPIGKWESCKQSKSNRQKVKVQTETSTTWSSIELYAARWISAVFNPLVFPTLGMILMLNQDTHMFLGVTSSARLILIVIVFANTALLPMLSIILLKRMGIVGDVLLNERSDRIIPLLLSAIYCLVTYFLFARLSIPGIIAINILGLSLLVIASTLITFFWKISLHMASIGGLTGFLFALPFVLQIDITGLIAMFLIISGFVGWARLRLNAHTPAQVYAGFSMGFFMMIIFILMLV